MYKDLVKSLDDSPWRHVMQLSFRMMESGFAVVDTGLQQMQTVANQMTGQPTPVRSKQELSEGPKDVEAATSELARQLLCLGYSLGREPSHGWPQALEALTRSAPRDVLDNPRLWPTLIFQLSLAASTLAVKESRQTLVALDVLRPSLWGDTIRFLVETASDLPVYFSLQYHEALETGQRYLRQHPNDASARLAVARTMMKCGLFQEAVKELETAARSPSVRQQAHYQSSVANYYLGDYRQAVHHGMAALERDIDDDEARYWLWLAAQKLGGYPEIVRENLRMKVASGFHPTSIELEEVSVQMGLDKTSGGRGTAVLDINGDGTLDVVIAGAHAGCSLFRNNGNGTFTDISRGSGLDNCVYAFNLSVGDYDNNGLPDLFVSGLGFYDGKCFLMHNNGDGTFTDVTEAAGLDMCGPAFTSTWVDYNGDGYLDLFVTYNASGLFDRLVPNRLFCNNGDGTFTDVTEAAGLRKVWPSLGATWGDFCNNGLPDLFLSNFGRAQLFRNHGDGTFSDVSREAGIDAPLIASMCLCCDIDNDGWLDIVQFSHSRPRDAIHTLRTGQPPKGASPMRIFRNNRDGTFTDIAPELGLSGCWGTMSGTIGDINNNGHLDLLLGNGTPSIDRTEAATLLENDGQQFHNVTFSAGLPFTGKGHGVNMADLTGDGRLHLIVSDGGFYPGDLLTSKVYRSAKRPGNYLNIRLAGTRSNRDAVGARLRLRAGGRDQHRLVSGGSGFGSLPYEQHFGLGTLLEVDELEIHWPSGHIQQLGTLQINRTLRIVEGHAAWEVIGIAASG